jgi:hypothetical protein
MTAMIVLNGRGYDTTVAIEMETQDHTVRDLAREGSVIAFQSFLFARCFLYCCSTGQDLTVVARK